jgi:hypothetical protein
MVDMGITVGLGIAHTDLESEMVASNGKGLGKLWATPFIQAPTAAKCLN